MRNRTLNRFQGGVDWAGFAFPDLLLPPSREPEHDGSLVTFHGARRDLERNESDAIPALRALPDHPLNGRHDVVVEEMFFLISELHQSRVNHIEFAVLEYVSEFAQYVFQAVSSRMLSENNRRFWHADALRRHDFVCLLIFQHAVLVNSGFVGKRTPAHDCLIAGNL